MLLPLPRFASTANKFSCAQPCLENSSIGRWQVEPCLLRPHVKVFNMALTNLAGGPRQISSQPRVHMKFLLGQERTKCSEMLHRRYFGTLIDILPFLSFSMRIVASGSLSLLTRVISSEPPPYESLSYSTSSLSEDRPL
jgi:hypothetical protein